jgi:hypothetical protein
MSSSLCIGFFPQYGFFHSKTFKFKISKKAWIYWKILYLTEQESYDVGIIYVLYIQREIFFFIPCS